jgi:hypothetical protein
MSIPLTVNEIVYQYPEVGDEDWGQNATQWAAAVSSLVANLRSATLPVATTGVFRLGTSDKVCWRNNANTLDACLFLNAADRLIYDDGIAQKDLGLTGASGNVQHLFPSTDNEITRFDGGIGTVIKTSGVFLDNSQNFTAINDVGCITVNASDKIVATNEVEVAGVEVSKALPPIGTIIPFYDYGVLTVDPTYWVPCDGNIHIVGGSSRLLPDLSNRYLVGFGTEAGKDIITDLFDVAPRGAPSHQISISHSHTVDSHTHPISGDGAHTHIVNSHNHTVNGHNHLTLGQTGFVATGSGTPPVAGFYGAALGTFTYTHTPLSAGVTQESQHIHSFAQFSESASPGTDSKTPGTDDPGTHSHGAATGGTSPGTDIAFVAAIDIQPRSIRVRFYMRAK